MEVFQYLLGGQVLHCARRRNTSAFLSRRVSSSSSKPAASSAPSSLPGITPSRSRTIAAFIDLIHSVRGVANNLGTLCLEGMYLRSSNLRSECGVFTPAEGAKTFSFAGLLTLGLLSKAESPRLVTHPSYRKLTTTLSIAADAALVDLSHS